MNRGQVGNRCMYLIYKRNLIDKLITKYNFKTANHIFLINNTKLRFQSRFLSSKNFKQKAKNNTNTIWLDL